MDDSLVAWSGDCLALTDGAECRDTAFSPGSRSDFTACIAYRSRWHSNFTALNFAWILPLVFIIWAGWNTYTDFGTWLSDETHDFGIDYDYRSNEAMFLLDAETPENQPIIMPTNDSYRATTAYLARGMNRDITFYRWSDGDCYLSPREVYTTLDLPIVLNSFATQVLPYVSHLETIANHPENDYNLYTVTPSDDLLFEWDNPPQFGEILSAQVIAPTENTVSAEDTLQIHWAMRISGDFDRGDYRVLVHLQGEPNALRWRRPL